MQPDVLEGTRRKRQRSTSGASESGGSSPKRAASEGPSLVSESGIRNSASVEPQPFSNLSIIEDHDIDAYMATQDGAQTQLPSQLHHKTWSANEKLDAFEHDVEKPLVYGASWYIVAVRWLKEWKMACRGEAGRQDARDEAALGPVDNSSLVDGNGDLKPDLLFTLDYEVIPQSWWDCFVEWYGPVEHVLKRQVTTRGDSRELFVECYLPRLKIYRLRAAANLAVKGQSETLSIQISLRASAREFLTALSGIYNVAPLSVRCWRLPEPVDLNGPEYTVELLRTSGAELLNVTGSDLDKALGDLLVNPSDEFIVEIQENGKWIVKSDEPLQHNDSALASKPNAPQPSEEPIVSPLFKSGGFFGQMSNRLGISSGGPPITNGPGSASSSTLKTSAYVSGRQTPVQTSRTPGTIGLGNLGNTCFMNSALQCLAHNQELTEYFLTELYREELNRENPLGMGGAIAEHFGSLLMRMWTSASGPSSFAPREFKQQLQRFAPQFSGYQQHDSQELVAFLLDGLHEDLNRVVKKPYVENPDWEGGGDRELVVLARKSWEGYISRNDSVIVDLFQGQYKSTLVCPECQKVSITFDPFMYLTLPLPIKKKWRHDVYYVPWDADKAHLRIPVEIDYDLSFKEVRRTLGKWTGSDHENLITLEVFQSRFYKYLDDSVPVSDMGPNDQVMCYELPCKTNMNGKHQNTSRDELLILPVYTSPVKTKSYSSHYDFIGIPFFVALLDEQTRKLDSIYAAVVDRLRRWTTNAKSLYKYVGVDHVPEEHVVPIVNGTAAPTMITEIRENGDVIVTQTSLVEEADIADEKPVTMIEDEIDVVEAIDPVPTAIGPQEDLFNMQLLNFPSSRSSMESISFGSHETPWSERLGTPGEPLVVPGDLLLCKWDETFQTFFLNEHALWSKDNFEEFTHPDYDGGKKQAEKRQSELTIEDCLDEFTKEEQLGEDDPWYCPRCKKHQQATKHLQLWKVPDVLVVHLKRFSNSRIMRDKLDAFIDFPLQGLDLDNRVGERQSTKSLVALGHDLRELGLDELDEPLLYDLFAVDEHRGGLGGGHYRAYALNHIDDEWYHFDDSHVSRCKPEDAVNPNAYLLFYRRRTNRPIGGKTYAKIQAARHSNSETSTLPTPPREPSPPALSQSNEPSILDEDYSLTQQQWTPSLPLDSISSSSTPPDLEESDAPLGLEHDLYDALEQSNLRYAMPSQLNGFQGRGSPTSSSSNEAEDGGSNTGASTPWRRHIADFIPSPPYRQAVLKPASFSPTGNPTFQLCPGQDPPSPVNSTSDLDYTRLGSHIWESEDRRSRLVGQLPSPEPEEIGHTDAQKSGQSKLYN